MCHWVGVGPLSIWSSDRHLHNSRDIEAFLSFISGTVDNSLYSKQNALWQKSKKQDEPFQEIKALVWPEPVLIWPDRCLAQPRLFDFLKWFIRRFRCLRQSQTSLQTWCQKGRRGTNNKSGITAAENRIYRTSNSSGILCWNKRRNSQNKSKIGVWPRWAREANGYRMYNM